MRILKRRDFLLCPAGTVFADYQSLGMFGTLSIKTDGPSATPDSDDFVRMDLDGTSANVHGSDGGCGSDEWMQAMVCAEDGARIDIHFDTTSRDGMFEREAQFAVFDDDDVERLIAALVNRKAGDQ
jgi:hypothetical protein